MDLIFNTVPSILSTQINSTFRMITKTTVITSLSNTNYLVFVI